MQRKSYIRSSLDPLAVVAAYVAITGQLSTVKQLNRNDSSMRRVSIHFGRDM
jgi:hypothetical protein